MSSKNQSDAAKKAAAAEEAAKKVAAEEAAKKAAADAAAASAGAAQPGTTKTIKVPALRVVSSREGFRRGGRAWGKEETTVKLSELNKEQIAQIKGEKLLTVTEVEVDEEVAAK